MKKLDRYASDYLDTLINSQMREGLKATIVNTFAQFDVHCSNYVQTSALLVNNDFF